MTDQRLNKALGYWSTGMQYLKLVDAVANEIILQGNRFILICDEELPLVQYEVDTKWSDHNLILPLLFNLYHGIELNLKGFIIAKVDNNVKNHKLSDLLREFESLFPGQALGIMLSRYILSEQMPEPLASFYSESSICADDYYQSMKYPEGNNGHLYRHKILKYRGDVGLNFFEGLVSDIKQIKIASVGLAKAIRKS